MLKHGQPFKKKNTDTWYEVISCDETSYTAMNLSTIQKEVVPFTDVEELVDIEIDLDQIPKDRLDMLYELAEKQGCTIGTIMSMILEEIVKDLVEENT